MDDAAAEGPTRRPGEREKEDGEPLLFGQDGGRARVVADEKNCVSQTATTTRSYALADDDMPPLPLTGSENAASGRRERHPTGHFEANINGEALGNESGGVLENGERAAERGQASVWCHRAVPKGADDKQFRE